MPLSSNITFVETTSLLDRQSWEYLDSADRRNVSWEGEVREPKVVLGVYLALMVVGATGNLAVLVAHVCKRYHCSGDDLLMKHLAVADVFVTCIVIPLEIGWKYTNAWLAGDLLCKILMVIRAFSTYLSSNMLVCISFDRFFGVTYPLKMLTARRIRTRMPCAAWIIALCCSLPQAALFRVVQDPYGSGVEQCVSFQAFSSFASAIVYNVFNSSVIYFIPQIIIITCYALIFFKLLRNQMKINERRRPSRNGGGMRRYESRLAQRARHSMLWRSVLSVAVFALCRLPHAALTMWYITNRESASRVYLALRDILWAATEGNSCTNPFLYGSRTFSLNDALLTTLHRICNPVPGLKNRDDIPLQDVAPTVTTARTRPRTAASSDDEACDCRDEDLCGHEETTAL